MRNVSKKVPADAGRGVRGKARTTGVWTTRPWDSDHGDSSAFLPAVNAGYRDPDDSAAIKALLLESRRNLSDRFWGGSTKVHDEEGPAYATLAEDSGSSRVMSFSRNWGRRKSRSLSLFGWLRCPTSSFPSFSHWRDEVSAVAGHSLSLRKLAVRLRVNRDRPLQL